MIVVDTNIVSEMAKPRPSSRVVLWFAENGPLLALPTPALAELYYGAYAMKIGRRREEIIAIYDDIVGKLADRILPFDQASAMIHAQLAAESDRKGRPIRGTDGQIAAIARRHKVPVATRDIEDFKSANVPLINPWED